ncbi:MAG: methyltransferase domain-containing protein [Thermoguttaceae bacterium]
MTQELHLTSKVKLAREDFFFVAEGSYDDWADRAILSYSEVQDAVSRSLRFADKQAVHIADLGAGSGVTTAAILSHLPHARVTAVELFDEMLDAAKDRLARFADRVTYVKADLMDYLASEECPVFDAVVSVFCIHHQSSEGKREFFRLAYQHLRSQGRLTLGDWTTFEDPLLREIARDETLKHLRAAVPDPENRRKWTEHWRDKNMPDSADSQIDWMRQEGFLAETLFRNYEVAVLCGRKP